MKTWILSGLIIFSGFSTGTSWGQIAVEDTRRQAFEERRQQMQEQQQQRREEIQQRREEQRENIQERREGR